MSGTPINVLSSEMSLKTTRQGQVKTMSQVNERHDRHFHQLYNSNSDASNQGAPASTGPHWSMGRKTETESQLQMKRDVNQQLIERLTGKPISTQDYTRHTQPQYGAYSEGLFNSSAISVQQKKKHTKEVIRQYKQQKESQNMLQRVSELKSENILDSKAVDERPNVNETVEMRRFAHYNNPNQMGMRGAMSSQNLHEKHNEDSEAANANMETKQSSRVKHPPFSISKKEIGLI